MSKIIEGINPKKKKLVGRIVIEFDGNNVSVSHPSDPIMTFGLLEIAKLEVASRMQGPNKEENKGGKIVIPDFRMKSGEKPS